MGGKNRIVVDYGDTEDLVLLGAIGTNSGNEMSYNDMLDNYSNDFTIVPRYNGITNLSKLKKMEQSNKEGFVVRFRNGLRIKIKFAEYVRLHSILTQMSNLVIWKSLRWGHQLDMADVPDEFDEWVKDTIDELLAEFGRVKYEINKKYYSILRKFVTDDGQLNSVKNVDQKEFVKLAKEHGKPYFGYIMQKFNGHDIDDTIWRSIRPKYSIPFIEEEL